MIDDIEVTKALLEKAYECAKKNNLEHIEGPMGFSNLDKVGVLTYGYDQVGNMITWYNHEYYKTHFETLGFTPEKNTLKASFCSHRSTTLLSIKPAGLSKNDMVSKL